MIVNFNKFNMNESKIATTIQDNIDDWYAGKDKNSAVKWISELTGKKVEEVKKILNDNNDADSMDILMDI